MEAPWLSGRSGGHTGPGLCWDIRPVTLWGLAGTPLPVHSCSSAVGQCLKRDMGELIPPGSHPLPSLVNPHCWISATAWWFGLCQLQSAVSQNMICLWQAFKCMCLLLIMCWVGFFSLFLLFFLN